MVKVNPNNSTTEEYYMDGVLRDNLDAVKPHVKKSWDMAFIISGIEGGGKSTLAFQCARYVSGARFTLDHVCFNVEDFMEKITRENFLLPGDSLILDEGFVINARASMTKLTRMFLSIMSECRQKQLFLFIIIPNFFDMDKNIALWRSRGLFYIYHDAMERGYFKFFSYEKKKKLYVLGKKFFNYQATKPNFIGRFTKYLPVDEEEYKRRKLKAFELRQKVTPQEDRFMHQRNLLFRKLKETGMSYQKISEYLTSNGEKLTHQAISQAVQQIANGK